MRRFFILITSCICLWLSQEAVAGSFPDKPITIVVPYGAGGIADIVARTYGESISTVLGVPVIVMNKPGASANIGPAYVARAAADGYTLVLSSTSMAMNPYIYKNIGWKPDEFSPVARLAESTNVFLVPASSGMKTLADFVKYAKTHKFLPTNVTSYGNSQALNREIFARKVGIKFNAVGYKGGVSYFTDLVNGALVFSVLPAGVSLPWIVGKKVTALATTGEHRVDALPDVPTLKELGYPAATATSWFGLDAPAGTPEIAIQKIAEAARQAAADPTLEKKLKTVTASAAFLGTADFAKFYQEEAARSQEFASLIRGRIGK
jgi:tripartite-type tricarboxylate transporter receptor subunit TctC